jgi:hypothetical protein
VISPFSALADALTAAESESTVNSAKKSAKIRFNIIFLPFGKIIGYLNVLYHKITVCAIGE